jgi:hypothetical protein
MLTIKEINNEPKIIKLPDAPFFIEECNKKRFSVFVNSLRDKEYLRVCLHSKYIHDANNILWSESKILENINDGSWMLYNGELTLIEAK